MQRFTTISRQRGMVLILVLLVVALLSLGGYTFVELMLAEQEAAEMHGRSVQAHALAESGLQAASIFLTQTKLEQRDAGGFYDNPGRFMGVLALDDVAPRDRGRFTLMAPRVEEGVISGVRYGLEDESTRLNLNMLLVADKQLPNGGRTLLMGLPGMTEEIADAILDWLDTDDEPREFGAEVDEYSGLVPPYAPKNGPLETVEELLLVRGVTPWLLFGGDANRNGVIDPHEQATADALGPVASVMNNPDGTTSTSEDTSPNLGWSRYLTLYSKEANKNAAGEARINVNGSDMEQLFADLLGKFNEETATFIVAYRQNGPFTGTANTLNPGPTGKLDLTVAAKSNLNSVLDLIDAKVQVTFTGNNQPTTLTSPFQSTKLLNSLPKMMDELTVNSSQSIPARIAINQATRTVLQGIPGMTADIVDAIISKRQTDPAQEEAGRENETWILSEGIVTLAQMKALIPFITTQGSVYRVQVVGFFEEGGPAARVEAIIDSTASSPRQLFWRDMSHLGRGYSLATLGAGGGI